MEKYQILLKALSQHQKLSVAEIIRIFEAEKIKNPQRSAKELSWELVEKGLARFDNEWRLQLLSTKGHLVIRLKDKALQGSRPQSASEHII